jgi:hypothetical protein
LRPAGVSPACFFPSSSSSSSSAAAASFASSSPIHQQEEGEEETAERKTRTGPYGSPSIRKGGTRTGKLPSPV